MPILEELEEDYILSIVLYACLFPAVNFFSDT